MRLDQRLQLSDPPRFGIGRERLAHGAGRSRPRLRPDTARRRQYGTTGSTPSDARRGRVHVTETYLDGVRRAYDTVAEDYAAQARGELADRPFDRALLTTFAELVARP